MIKIFEEYNEYYTRIHHDEFEDINSLDCIDFTEIEIKSIMKVLMKIRPSKPYFTYDFFFEKKEMIILHQKSILITILKLPDEWYYVADRTEYYKCDQLEGLLQYLNTIYIKTPWEA